MERPEPPPGTAAGQEEQELRERAFFSWAEFSRFFDAWCQQRLALFFVKSSMHLARCRWASAPPLYTLIDVLKYSYVRLVCKDVRAPSRPAVGPPQPGCPAFIIVKLSPLRDRLVVTECQLTHSHPACPLEFAYYFRPGHLLANACLPVRTTNKISKQFVAPADVRRLLSYCKGRDHGVLDALHVKLVFVEDQAVVETVFFLTSRTRALLRRFPRMLLRVRGLETGDWGGASKEASICRGAQMEKEWARALETRDWGGAQFEGEKGRALQIRDWRGGQSENQKPRGLEGGVLGGSQLEKGHLKGPEIRDWRGPQLEGEKDWGLEGYVWRAAQLEDQALRGLEGYTWRVAQLEDRGRALETTDLRGTQFDYERVRSLEGSPWRGVQLHDEKAGGLRTAEWKGPQSEVEKGRALEVRNLRGIPLEKSLELAPENGDPRGPQWEDERRRGPETAEERGARVGAKRRRGLEDIVLVQLGDTRVTGVENGDGGGARSVGPKSRAGRGMEWADAGGRCLGLGNGVVCGTPVGTVLEGSPEWAVVRSEHLAAGDGLQEGGEDGPREPKRLCRPPGEEEVDWEPLAKFRAACGPELADLVAEELAFARQHGTRGFHWTGAGFALKDGTSDFFLDGALTRCSCSIHAARRLPCRHLFAARLLTGAALFHMDLLRDCWGRAPEP
ncbi:PREDICTED: uncharacterized protein C19orf68 homolog [Mandrillus leucophaeus]|uniref:uncharacterized protein C19orf68 homolog n=1 Tax=Mandrillus leucophaeus TaxID=9568 RepID=UPI0005F4338F|nr:PREDICTED: uncharacterized protein C19orf68 homolog [Mandrillus leucophaeus]